MATATAAQQSALVLDADWSRGMIRDAPRGSIPEGGVYNSEDYLLHRPGLAQKRGGWAYAGPALTGSAHAAVVAYAPYTPGAKVLAIGDTGDLFEVASGSTTLISALGDEFVSRDTPKFRVGASKEILVITAKDGNTRPKIYQYRDDTEVFSVTNLGGTPPPAKFACLYKSRLVLANTKDNPDRVFFSPVPDINDDWDVTESWIDTDYPVVGMASLQNTIVVFSAGKAQRITGTTPPPGTDMDRSPIGDIGCTDARSIVVYEGRVIFANGTGVYWTDGNTYKSLTRDGGIDGYWRDFFSAALPPSHIACGLLGNFLLVSLLDTNGDYVTSLMCYLPRNAWWPVTNLKARMFATAVSTSAECYFASADTNRVMQTSGFLAPAAGNKTDEDGHEIAPVLETRLLAGGPTLKAFGLGHLSMDMRDADGDNPTMTVAVAPGLEAPAFTAVPESPLEEQTDSTRYRFAVSQVSQGVTVRLTQNGPSSKTEVSALELETRALPYQAGGQ